MLCKEIHELPDGCDQVIPDGKQWMFCPACGSPTGHLQRPVCEFPVKCDLTSEHVVTFRNNGESGIKVSVSITPTIDGFCLSTNQPNSFIIAARTNKALRLTIPAMRESGTPGILHIQVNDLPIPYGIDHWCGVPGTRTLDVDVVCNIEIPGELQPQQECLIFHDGISEREVSFKNHGRTPVNVTGVSCPDGYQVKDVTYGAVKSDNDFKFKVERQPEITVSPTTDIRVTTSAGDVHLIHLYSEPPEGAREVTTAIIGVDFGTAYTSVAFRECRYNNLVDDVRYLHPPECNTDRFPTRIWVGKSKELAFSSKATERYIDDPGGGYLFREVKTLLREPDNVNIHPERDKSGAIKICKDWLGDNWQEKLVTEYLSWLYSAIIVPEIEKRYGTTEVQVQYVFTIPVLDYATDRELYNEQRYKMEQCVAAAGFPGEYVEFPHEPVCAAIGLLHPVKNDKELPRLNDARHPIANNCRIAVFDSGGGTTDVVLAEVSVDTNNKISLEVISCLGVGSKAETFGGELVTTKIIRAINNPETVPANRQEWSSGDLHVNKLSPTLNNEDDLQIRDKIEELKAALSQKDANDFEGLEGMVIKPSIFRYTLKDELKSLNNELSSRVFNDEPRSQIDYYVCVGGNTCVAFIARYFELFMQDDHPDRGRRRLVIPEEQDKKLAVAYGAVWFPDASIKNAFPYDVIIRTSHDFEITKFRKNSPQEVVKTIREYVIPPHDSSTLSILACIGSEQMSVGSCRLLNPYSSRAMLSIITEVEKSEIRIKYAIKDTTVENTEFGEYQRVLAYRL